MATERSDYESWKKYPDQEKYDLNYHKEILLRSKGKVLDIGCGRGILTKKIAEKEEVTEVYAIDRFEERETHPKITHITFDITQGLALREKFDTIVSTEFIEHITKEDLLKLLAEVKEMAGTFIGTTPIKVRPTTNPFHLQEYTVKELEEILKQFFKEVEIKDIGQYCQLWIAQS
jgi:2-polyprenyl-3-methyl-5-hydroxy-6-metoxy-1,4-benzoquinol methylase